MKNKNIDYWNKFYKRFKIQQPSKFALFAYKKLTKLKKKVYNDRCRLWKWKRYNFFYKKKN